MIQIDLSAYSENGLLTDIGYAFERYVVDVLIKCGYNAYKTPSTQDFGGDVIAEKDGVKYAIQCKYSADSIGIKACQEALAGKEYYKCDKAVVLTNSEFTNKAVEFAKATTIELWDYKHLQDFIKLAENSKVDSDETVKCMINSNTIEELKAHEPELNYMCVICESLQLNKTNETSTVTDHSRSYSVNYSTNKANFFYKDSNGLIHNKVKDIMEFVFTDWYFVLEACFDDIAIQWGDLEIYKDWIKIYWQKMELVLDSYDLFNKHEEQNGFVLRSMQPSIDMPILTIDELIQQFEPILLAKFPPVDMRLIHIKEAIDCLKTNEVDFNRMCSFCSTIQFEDGRNYEGFDNLVNYYRDEQYVMHNKIDEVKRWGTTASGMSVTHNLNELTDQLDKDWGALEQEKDYVRSYDKKFCTVYLPIYERITAMNSKPLKSNIVKPQMTYSNKVNNKQLIISNSNTQVLPSKKQGNIKQAFLRSFLDKLFKGLF